MSIPTKSTLSVTFILYEGYAAIDAAGPADVFQAANDLSEKALYDLHYVSAGGEVCASNGMRLTTGSLDIPSHHLSGMVFVPGAERGGLRVAIAHAATLQALLRFAAVARRVCSVCSGAFLLASTGLLDGRRATTHWRGMDQLARSFPKIRLQRDVLYVEDGNIWTSAGVTSGIDMALAIVEQDHGRPLALAVAREMVLFLVRPGGQAQFSAPLDLQSKAATSDLGSLPFWLETRLSESISVADMAAAVSMSERNFHRRCNAAFGLTPNALLQRLRLEHARRLLEDATLPLKEVARQSGFTDLSALGKAFRLNFGVTPGDYRAHFGDGAMGENEYSWPELKSL